MKLNIAYILLVMIAITGCKKYLDAKSNKSLVVPQTVADLQALLDNNTIMNRASPSDGEGSSDNYYLSYDDWEKLDPAYRNIYTWGDEIVYDIFPNDWSQSYDQVYFCNTALEGLDKIERTTVNAAAWDNVKGSALVFRANAFFKLVTTWSVAYDSVSATTDLGIPLRLNSDFNQPSTRASVDACYKQIIEDLQQAVPLLPATPAYITRPSKVAAYALLSRTYLAMRKYSEAGLYADSSLQLNNSLLDYNTLNKKAAYPIPPFNKEMVFYVSTYGYELASNIANIDSTLYAVYESGDLRKSIFFKTKRNIATFKGGYNGDYTLFTGIATDEMYLTRAEYEARENNVPAALNDLNTLLSMRWKTGTFTPLATTDANEALQWILNERRKELLMRDLRWMDLKRLNKEPVFQTTLTRKLNGQVYILPPNDPRYALPLPQVVVTQTGMQQNPR